jgi:hypothetical protein
VQEKADLDAGERLALRRRGHVALDALGDAPELGFGGGVRALSVFRVSTSELRRRSESTGLLRPAGVDQPAEEHGEEHEVVVLDPDHAAGLDDLLDGEGELEVRLAVREPVRLVKVHLAGVVVEEGPEDRVGEAVVVAVGDVVVEVDGLARVLLLEALVDDRPVLGRDVEAGPADPGEGHGLFAAREGRDEPAGGHLEVVRAGRILGDGDRQPVGDDDEVRRRAKVGGAHRVGGGAGGGLGGHLRTWVFRSGAGYARGDPGVLSEGLATGDGRHGRQAQR